MILALRVAGERELGQTNTLDLVVLLLVANAVDVSVTGAIVGGLVLFGLNSLLSRGLYGWELLARLVEGEPTELICDGQLQLSALRRDKSPRQNSERSPAARASRTSTPSKQRSSRPTV